MCLQAGRDSSDEDPRRRRSRKLRAGAARGIAEGALNAPEPLRVPGITDALGTRLVERAGFAASYATGAGIANAQFGLAGIGLVSLGELAGQASRVIDATGLPVIVDADTGFGGALSVMRTTHLLETAGAAGIQLEDQRMPKRCGHFDGHELADTGGMAAALRAAANPSVQVAIFEKSTKHDCNTQISSGSLAAGGTRFQAAAGITDSPGRHADDILAA